MLDAGQNALIRPSISDLPQTHRVPKSTAPKLPSEDCGVTPACAPQETCWISIAGLSGPRGVNYIFIFDSTTSQPALQKVLHRYAMILPQLVASRVVRIGPPPRAHLRDL